MTEQNIRVLLVEDDDIDREAIERHIEEMQLPYILQTAASRGEALERLRTSAYDVVLLDYMLADGTGLELLPHVEETPSIIITGRGSEQVAVEAVQRGAYDYLIKDPERNYLTVLPLTIRNVLTRKHAEKALREKDTRYRLLIEASASGISLLDKDGNFLFVNEPTAKIWGKRPEDVINKNLKDVVPPEFADEALNIIRKMSETETGLEQERCIEPLHKHFIENIQPIFDAKKKFLGVQVITFDITDRKRTEEALRESNQKLQANLTYLESMTTISKISGQHFELEDMIAKIIEAVFEIFDPDRAWLQFPGDPNSPTFRVHYEYARQEYPGAKIEGIDVPMDDGTKGIIRDLLSTDEPVTYDLSNSMFKKTGAVKHFSVQS